ncbi:hypothetical protein N0V90_003562 [Kalmusia sp. IMI 367209]|nr:hypothetical protein N0V90_003562 [Kalmusia sp. IMI 367209]
MRLLQRNDDGAYTQTEFIGNAIPHYAILSHTWGVEHEEVTFADLENGTGTTKIGYRKLQFCADQAAKDNLRYFWVDTCCIDKSSSAELSEAINSMFRWYHNAAKCYVYLSDVHSISASTRDDPNSQWTWKPAFQNSWTLQELLAPRSVEFFSAEGDRLGDKVSMMQEIHDITNIKAEALQGASLSQFTIEERISWSIERETKREEDAAYSLLGICEIHMSLIYGEGRENAFFRLDREIEQSPAVQEKRKKKAAKEYRKQAEAATKLLEAARAAREEAEAKAAKEAEDTVEAHKKAVAEATTAELDLNEARAEAFKELQAFYEEALAESTAAIEKLKNATTALEEETAKLKLSDIGKPPIKLKDTVGQQFSLPWHLCKTRKGMEESIKQAFLCVDRISPHVHEGHYDLIDSNGEIILPQAWETTVQPDMISTMHMWPMPEPPKDALTPSFPPAACLARFSPLAKSESEGKGGKSGGSDATTPDNPRCANENSLEKEEGYAITTHAMGLGQIESLAHAVDIIA